MNELTNILPPVQNKSLLVVNNHLTKDIMNLIHSTHRDTQTDYDKISKLFWRGNAERTARHLFDYARKYIKYQVEPGTIQTVKDPSVIALSGKGDCKHFASFIVGVADSLARQGYPIRAGYMYVNEADNTANYHHVFAVITDPNTNVSYWVDPIPGKKFNERKKYLKSKFVPMSLYRLSGPAVGKRQKLSKAERKANKARNKAARKANHQARKEERKKVRAMPKAERKAYKKAKHQQKKEDRKAVKKIATGAEKVAHVAMVVPNAISRNAMLGLLKLNAFHMADKIAAKYVQDGNWANQLKRHWYAAGGSWAKFRQAVNQGVNVYNKKFTKQLAHIGEITPDARGLYIMSEADAIKPFELKRWQAPICNCDSLSEMEDNLSMAGIGEPDTIVAIAAMVAAAMPIIIKLTTLLKKANVDTDNLNEAGNDSAEEIIDQYNDAQDYPMEEDDVSNFGESDSPQFGIQAYNDPNNGGKATIKYTRSNLDSNGDVSYTPNNTKLNMVMDSVTTFFEDNKTTLLWIGGGIVALKYGPDLIRSIVPRRKKRGR